MPYDPDQEPYVALRTKALESLLIEKGLLSAGAVDDRISQYERDIGPLNGARVVARAWVDPAFRERLLKEGSAAIAELGLPIKPAFGSCRKHTRGPQHGGLHALLVLPLDCAGVAPDLV